MNTREKVIDPQNNQEIYYAKNVRNNFFIPQLDSELCILYRPNIRGFAMGNTDFLSEDNVRFIKVLIKHRRLNSSDELNQEIIKKIVQDLDYDSDLWDDIFDHEDVFRSVYSEEDIRKAEQSAKPASKTHIDKVKMERSIDFYRQGRALNNYPLQFIPVENLAAQQMLAEFKKKLTTGIYLYRGESKVYAQVVHNKITEETVNLSEIPGSPSVLREIQSILSKIQWQALNREEIISEKEARTIKAIVGFRCRFNELSSNFNSDSDCREFIKSRINVFKFYIYLRRCAILYRDTNYKQPLCDLINFLKMKKQPGQKIMNYQWLKNQLRVAPMTFFDENWNSGLHEWLTCDQTLEAIERTAGKIDGTKACLSECIWAYKKDDGTEGEYLCSEFNWLDLQLLLRTPNKYVIFKSRIDTVENGHCSSVNYHENPAKASSGKCTAATENSISEHAFHQELNTLFKQSRTVKEYVVAIQDKYNVSVFHDGTPVQAVKQYQRRFLVDGTPTDDLQKLKIFQNKLINPHKFFSHYRRDIEIHEKMVKEGIAHKRTDVA